METDRVGLTHRGIQTIGVVELYYSGRSQNEVTEALHVSRPNISKFLTHARERGFIRITVEGPREEDKEFINYLKIASHLVEVRLVAPISSKASELRKILGQAGAALLRELIRDGGIAGTAWSRIMGQVTATIGETEFKDVKVMPLCGNTGDSSTDFPISQGFGILRRSLNAEAYPIGHPCFLVSVAAGQSITGLGEVRRTTGMATEFHIVAYTMETKASITHAMVNAVSDEEQKRHLIELTVEGICSHFIDASTRVCLPDLNARTLSISLLDLHRKEQRVLVTGGTDRLEAIYATLSSGYANRSVTDVITARKLYANHHRLQFE